MPDAAQNGLLPAREVARLTPLEVAANGLHYASFGYTEVPADSLRQVVEAVPPGIGAILSQRAYYFVPLALGETEETEIARGFSIDLGDRATCHRNLVADTSLAAAAECTFISARLMQDRFALAFEFFINIGHQLVDTASVPRPFQELAWAQARADVRGETSQDAWEARARAIELSGPSTTTSLAGGAPQPAAHSDNGNDVSLFASRESQGTRTNPSRNRSEVVRMDSGRVQGARLDAASSATIAPAFELSSEEQVTFFEAAFADTLAIYMLSLAMDLDYADLREREYPLLAAPALADRLRLVAELFPPAPGYEFSIRYRRRH